MYVHGRHCYEEGSWKIKGKSSEQDIGVPTASPPVTGGDVVQGRRAIVASSPTHLMEKALRALVLDWFPVAPWTVRP